MKKKLVSVILVGAMAATLLAGCGSSGESSADAEAATDTAETTEEAGDASEDVEVVEDEAVEEETAGEGTEGEEAAEADTSASEIAPDGIDYEEVELTASISFPETTVYGEYLTTFIDYVEGTSNGAVTFNPYYGGTICDAGEEMEYVQDGTLDIAFSLAAYAMDTIPMYNLVGFSPDGNQGSIDVAYHVYFDNEETAQLAQAEAAAAGVQVLGIMSGPSNAACATIPIASLEDLQDTNMGGDAFVQTFINLGVKDQTVELSDIYESLSRGMIDATSGGLSPIVTNGWSEVCQNILCFAVADATPTVIMNLDKYDSLPEETQQLLLDGAKYASEQSVALMEEDDKENIAILEDQGCTIEYLSDEDNARFVEEAYKGNYESYYPFAEAIGDGDAMDAIAEEALTYMGLDLTLDDLKATLE